jgi:hypothetical protein
VVGALESWGSDQRKGLRGVVGAQVGGFPFIGPGRGGAAKRRVDTNAFMVAQCVGYRSGGGSREGRRRGQAV